MSDDMCTNAPNGYCGKCYSSLVSDLKAEIERLQKDNARLRVEEAKMRKRWCNATDARHFEMAGRRRERDRAREAERKLKLARVTSKAWKALARMNRRLAKQLKSEIFQLNCKLREEKARTDRARKGVTNLQHHMRAFTKGRW